MSSERPVREGWESRERLYPVSASTAVAEAILVDAVERIADKIDGLDSNGPNAAEYEAFVFAYDDEVARVAMADQLYSCALTGGALIDCLGGEAFQIDTAYAGRGGTAVSGLKQVGIDLNKWLRTVGRELAWIDTTQKTAPLPMGPWVGLVGNNGQEGPEHVIIGRRGPDGQGHIPVVEGGQLSLHGKGYRIAKAVYEAKVRAPGDVWLRRVAPQTSLPRRLRGYLDLAAMPFTQRCVLPVEAA